MSTNAEHTRLVPDPDFCVVLFQHGFPQKTRFYWATSGILNAKQEDIWVLLTIDELEANGLAPGMGNCFAAPVAEEFMCVVPMQYFVTFARFGYIFVDITKTTISKEEPMPEIVKVPNMAEDTEALKKKVVGVGISFFRIKEADSNTAANCYAKALCYLLIKKMMSFKAPKENLEAETKKS